MWVLNKLIYGSSAVSEADEEVLGEQLETQQVEDWVVVNSPGENNAVTLQEEEELESEERPVQQEQTPAELVARQHRHNIQAVLNPNVLISQQVKSLRSARRCQYIKAHENITSGKCQRQNMARDCQGQPKGNSRKNKRVRPSGFKASRVAQRM